MKRMIAAACAMALLVGLIAAPAGAAIRTFHGPINGGGNIRFDVKFRDGKPRQAGNFLVRHLPVSCDGENIEVQYSTGAFVPVSQREFSYVFSSFTARIDGKLSRSFENASGTTKFGPNDVGGSTNCTSGGPRSWTASR